MGWASGDEIFDPVATALIAARVEESALDSVCTVLAQKLMDRGWDTEDESVGEFRGHPVVQHAIRRAQGQISLDVGTDEYGRWSLQHDNEAGWTLYDGEQVLRTAPDSWVGFNRLVEVWADRFVPQQERAEAIDYYRLS